MPAGQCVRHEGIKAVVVPTETERILLRSARPACTRREVKSRVLSWLVRTCGETICFPVSQPVMSISRAIGNGRNSAPPGDMNDFACAPYTAGMKPPRPVRELQLREVSDRVRKTGSVLLNDRSLDTDRRERWPREDRLHRSSPVQRPPSLSRCSLPGVTTVVCMQSRPDVNDHDHGTLLSPAGTAVSGIHTDRTRLGYPFVPASSRKA